MKNRRLIFNLITLMFLAFIVSINGCKPKDKNNLVVACNLPMSGDLAFYGQEISESINMFMEDYRDSLKNQNLNIIYNFQDNAGNAKDAVSIYKKHEIEGFDIYMSGVTAQTGAIYDQVKNTQKPHFVWSFMPYKLIPNENTFRTWVDLAYEGELFLKYIDFVKPKSVAFLYQNILSTQEQFNKLLAPEIKKRGINLIYNEAYDVSTTDFKNYMAKLKTTNPDIIIIYGFKSHLTEIIKGLNSNNIKKDGNVLCSFDFLDVVDIIPAELLEGIVTNVPQYVIDSSSNVSKWKSRFVKKYNRAPLFTDAYAYDCAHIIYKAAIEYSKAGNDKTFSQILLTVEIDGITGKLHFNNAGELKYNVEVCKFTNGNYSVLDFD